MMLVDNFNKAINDEQLTITIIDSVGYWIQTSLQWLIVINYVCM